MLWKLAANGPDHDSGSCWILGSRLLYTSPKILQHCSQLAMGLCDPCSLCLGSLHMSFRWSPVTKPKRMSFVCDTPVTFGQWKVLLEAVRHQSMICALEELYEHHLCSRKWSDIAHKHSHWCCKYQLPDKVALWPCRPLPTACC